MGDQYLGEIRMVGFNFAPQGWLLCNGQTLNISSNNALFALLGTTYGGNGTQTFQIPDLQCRVPVHAGNGAGLTPITLGEKAGVQNLTLNQQQMPQHTHIATFTPSGGGTPTVTVNIQAGNQAAQATAPATPFLAGSTAPSGHVAGQALYASSAGTAAPNLGGVSATITGVGGGTVANAPTGNSQPVNIQNPYVAVYFIIATTGIFPSRA